MSDSSVFLEQTVTHRHFQSLAVSFAMSSPIFFGDRPSGLSSSPVVRVLLINHLNLTSLLFKNNRLHHRRPAFKPDFRPAFQPDHKSCRKFGSQILTAGITVHNRGHCLQPESLFIHSRGHCLQPGSLFTAGVTVYSQPGSLFAAGVTVYSRDHCSFTAGVTVYSWSHCL